MADDDSDPNDDMLDSSESLDSDEIGEDGEYDISDPSRGWTGATHQGTTAAEERAGETLDERLAEEVPDVEPVAQPDRPSANTEPEDLDESIDEIVVPGEPADGEDIAYD